METIVESKTHYMNDKTQSNKWTIEQLEYFKSYYKYLYLQETFNNILSVCALVYFEQDVFVPFAINLIMNIIMGTQALWLSRRTIVENELTKECLLHNSSIVMSVMMSQYRTYCHFTLVYGLIVIICNVYYTFKCCFFNVRYDLTMLNIFMFNLMTQILTFKLN